MQITQLIPQTAAEHSMLNDFNYLLSEPELYENPTPRILAEDIIDEPEPYDYTREMLIAFLERHNANLDTLLEP